MNKAHYIIFHPDSARDEIEVRATAMVNGELLNEWTGNIHVDSIGQGNEDPFVFNNPWIYSYCHASQLRRNYRKDSFLQTGSMLIFASGEKANEGILCVDTVFLINEVLKWGNNPLELPKKYQNIFYDENSELWQRHLKFPFEGHHKKVSHTYEAKLWSEFETNFSFLPLDRKGYRILIPFDNFDGEIVQKISRNVHGKYPVLLNNSEIEIICGEIEKATVTKVLRIENFLSKVSEGKNICYKKC